MNTCIITGVTSGIGRETVIALGKKGTFKHLAMIGRDERRLLEVKTIVEKIGKATASIWITDLSIPEKLPNIIDEINCKIGKIECLLNIAGYTDPQPLLTTTLENMKNTYSVNVFTPFVLMRECAKHMKKNGGKILNVASTAGITPRPGWLSYASSKAALISMSETLTEELSEYGILIYCVSPGRCATKLRKRLAPDEDPTTIMQPNEVAKVICNLVEENEHCLDGQNIIIRKRINK